MSIWPMTKINAQMANSLSCHIPEGALSIGKFVPMQLQTQLLTRGHAFLGKGPPGTQCTHCFAQSIGGPTSWLISTTYLIMYYMCYV